MAYWQALPRDEQRDARLVADLAGALIAAGDTAAAQQAIETQLAHALGFTAGRALRPLRGRRGAGPAGLRRRLASASPVTRSCC